MDTKWSGTTERAADERPGRGRSVRALAAAAAFFLGVSLTAGSLSAAAGRWAWERDLEGWWYGDWQDTPAFREEVSDYLREFLTLGAGGGLGWYAVTAGDVIVAEETGSLFFGGTGTAWSEAREAGLAEAGSWDGEEVPDGEEDRCLRDDKNVLYRVRRQDGRGWYSNLEPGQTLAGPAHLPEGYNFLLTFQDGKTRIFQHGRELDVYGGGFYGGDSQWFVPGYQNFPAGEEVDGVTVQMAVREEPVRFIRQDYRAGGGDPSCRMYWLYQRLQRTRAFYRGLAAALGAGLACLAAWFPLRRAKALADRRVAAVTRRVPTEARFLLAAACLLLLLAGGPGGSGWWYDFWYGGWYEFWYEGLHLQAAELLRRLAACLDNVPAVLALLWTLWLIRNDHRWHPKERRFSLIRSAVRAVRARALRYPVQRRLSRGAVIRPLALWALAGGYAVLSWALITPACDQYWYLLTPCAAALAIALQILWARRDLALARDVGRLADQIESVRSGELDSALELPGDADLRGAAESLNDIQSGMKAALEDQMRSERMKVELVSNVSHDLKTPLTSILSYAELLRQEPLEGAAADYARIIGEKAQRLKGMVQDVFEVSEAASGQLPVTLERLDLAKLLRQTLADLDEPVRRSGLAFRVDLPEGEAPVMADGRRLYRVFQNLVDNALKYALPGSRVYLSLKAEAGTAEASLRNTSRDELPSGVDFTARFVRGDASRTGGGSGLGLSIADSFVRACGGEFRVETVADLFTAVVTLPLAE